MFNSYKNLSKSYIPNNSREEYIETNVAKLPLVEYNIHGQAIGYTWAYGNNIVLEFITEGYASSDSINYFEDVYTYLADKYMRLNIYNFKHDIVFTETLNAHPTTRFELVGEKAAKLVRNVYTCDLTLLDSEGKEIVTLFNEDYGKIYIK